MLKQIQQWFQRPTANQQDLLSDILSRKQGQEELLGIAQMSLPSAAQILNDISKVCAYSNSSDYKVWAEEAWSMVLEDLDKLLKPEAKTEEINFYRGCLSRTLALLRISHKARLKEPAFRKQAEQHGASRPIPR